jgi:large subunit ribosomal protein L32
MVNRMRHNRSQRGSTRSHHALKSASLTKCPDCGQSRLNHRVCGNCGKYNGKKVIIFEVKAKKGEKIKKEDKKAQEK